MAEKYYSILTNRGKELEAQSSATGRPVIIKDFVVGDGNGQPVKPDPTRTALVHEVYRNAISALQVSPDQANQFIAQLVLPDDVGGFVVREVGLLTDTGELYSVANCAAIEKPENGVSVSLQYRLAVSESANIELKVATGDGLFLRQDANLSDVKDAVQSRKSLGLKGAAVLDVGITVGTVAAGDDTRIVNALQKNNNLSELTDKAKARTALELKTAAVADVQTSKDDITAGRVLANGGALAVRTVAAKADGTGNNVSDANNLPGNSVSFLYPTADNSAGINGSLIDFSGLGGGYNTQITGQYSGGGKSIKFRTRDGDQKIWNPWYDIYHSGNKPTAADVNAIPLTGSTAVTGIIRSSAEFQTTSANCYRMVGGNYGAFWRQDGSNLYLMLTNSGDQYGNYNSLRPFSVSLSSGDVTIGKLNLTNFQYFDARYYTKTESDARYQPKGSYTPAGQAYTKAESDSRFQKINSASLAANGWFRDTNTGMLIQYGKVEVTTDGQNFTFPVAFSLIPTLALTVNGGAYGDVGASSISTTGFVVKAASKNTVGYIAIGK
ncbi:phage tail protein [Pantoea agglomerans]